MQRDSDLTAMSTGGKHGGGHPPIQYSANEWVAWKNTTPSQTLTVCWSHNTTDWLWETQIGELFAPVAGGQEPTSTEKTWLPIDLINFSPQPCWSSCKCRHPAPASASYNKLAAKCWRSTQVTGNLLLLRRAESKISLRQSFFEVRITCSQILLLVKVGEKVTFVCLWRKQTYRCNSCGWI